MTNTPEIKNNEWINLNLAENKLIALFRELIAHPGFGELRADIKILRKGQKEVVVSCGKQYRFVLKPAGNPANRDKPAVNKIENI
jgi:hypothetical protein